MSAKIDFELNFHNISPLHFKTDSRLLFLPPFSTVGKSKNQSYKYDLFTPDSPRKLVEVKQNVNPTVGNRQVGIGVLKINL